jgi:hypothetical protein
LTGELTDALLKRLTEYEKSPSELKASKVLLIGVVGKRGEPLDAEVGRTLQRLDAASVPYRLFSVGNAQLKWSAFDQLGSLLQAASGIPHKLRLPWVRVDDPPFLLGVDLGHPMRSRDSWATISIVSYEGIHLGSWRARQRRNETFDADLLKSGLSWAKERMQQGSPGRLPGVLVVRDGRLHKHETVEAYSKGLGCPTSFVEFAKYDNPEMFTLDPRPTPVHGGTECLVEGSCTPFIAPISPRLPQDLSRVFKLHMREQDDGLSLGMDRVSNVLIGLSYAPALGLQPHALPAPVYWGRRRCVYKRNQPPIFWPTHYPP